MKKHFKSFAVVVTGLVWFVLLQLMLIFEQFTLATIFLALPWIAIAGLWHWGSEQYNKGYADGTEEGCLDGFTIGYSEGQEDQDDL